MAVKRFTIGQYQLPGSTMTKLEVFPLATKPGSPMR
jgi:hypothetical protein